MGMRVKLEGITVLALDVPRLTSFYRDVLGFKVLVEEEHYTEFENDGVRLAIFAAPLMADNTNGHHSFVEERRGQAFELNFECDTPEDVYVMYDDFVSKRGYRDNSAEGDVLGAHHGLLCRSRRQHSFPLCS